MTNNFFGKKNGIVQYFSANRRSITRFYPLFFHVATRRLYCCKWLHLTQVLIPNAQVDDFYYEDVWFTTHVEVLSRHSVGSRLIKHAAEHIHAMNRQLASE